MLNVSLSFVMWCLIHTNLIVHGDVFANILFLLLACQLLCPHLLSAYQDKKGLLRYYIDTCTTTVRTLT